LPGTPVTKHDRTRELKLDAPQARNYRKLTVTRGGEVVTTMLGGCRPALIPKFELAGAAG
jgi:hypothetical protein